ncbi:hypothetical protein BX070DRAFT_101111 [Coemansia spiralis]|nr:hypothetical protein BX070DRAFT_101111 [Coemansia spiralis]
MVNRALMHLVLLCWYPQILQAAPQGKSEIVNTLMALVRKIESQQHVSCWIRQLPAYWRQWPWCVAPVCAAPCRQPAQSSSQKVYRNGTCAGLSGWKAGARQALYFRKQDHGAIAGRAMF